MHTLQYNTKRKGAEVLKGVSFTIKKGQTVALSELSEGRTTLVVAHRRSTVKNADEILVVTDGEIIEQGDHNALVEKGGLYAELYRYQFRE